MPPRVFAEYLREISRLRIFVRGVNPKKEFLYIKVFLGLKILLALNQLIAGDNFTRCTGQHGYKIYMYMSYRKKKKQNSVHFIIWLKTEHDGQIWHQRVEELGNCNCTPVILQRQLTRQATICADIKKNAVTGIPTVRKRLILALFWYYLEYYFARFT